MAETMSAENEIIAKLAAQYGMGKSFTAAVKAFSCVVSREAYASGVTDSAKVADTEAEPDGEMPNEFHGLPVEDLVRGTVRATRISISERIRRLIPNQEGEK